MKNLFLLTMIISSLAQFCHLQAAAEERNKLLKAVEVKKEKFAAMVDALESPICNGQIDQIQESLDEIVRLEKPTYKKIYDEIFILRNRRDQDDCCCVWWPWRSVKDVLIEEQRTENFKLIVAEVLNSSMKIDAYNLINRADRS